MEFKSMILGVIDCTDWSAEARKAEDSIVFSLVKIYMRDGTPAEGTTRTHYLETTGVNYDWGRKKFAISGAAALVDHMISLTTDLRVTVPASGVQYVLRPTAVDGSVLVAAARHQKTKFKAKLELGTMTAEFPPTDANVERAEDVGRNVCAILGMKLLRMNRGKSTDTGRPLTFYYMDMDLLDHTNGYNILALQREDVKNPAFPSGSHARFQLDENLCRDEGICKKCYRPLDACKCPKGRQGAGRELRAGQKQGPAESGGRAL